MQSLAAITRISRHQSFAISRRYLNSQATTNPTITLYQYAICPFCNINKALLSYTDTPYTIQEVNPLTKAEIKFSKDGYKKVPIATLLPEGSEEEIQQINGSQEINEAILFLPSVVETLRNKHKHGTDANANANSLSIEAFQNSPQSQKWQTFARDELAPILYPNICNTLSDSYAAFGYVDNDNNGKHSHSPIANQFTTLQKIMIRSIGSVAMYFAASKIKSKRNIQDERKALRMALDRWAEEGLENGENFYGSGLDVPDLGDLAMFGVLRSVHGLRTHDEMVLGKQHASSGSDADANPIVLDWYLRMEQQVHGG